MSIVAERMSIPKRKVILQENTHSHLQHACMAASMEIGLPLSVFWLVHPPSTGSFWPQQQQPAMGRSGPENTDFHGSFGHRLEPSSFQMLKKNGWNCDSTARGRGASFKLSVDWGLGNPSYTWEIRVYLSVYSLMETSCRIKLWKHDLEHAFSGSGVPSFGYGQYITYAVYYIWPLF